MPRPSPEPATPRCSSCKGVFHPQTGHAHSAAVVICGPCARRFFAWLERHTRPRKNADFYGAATRWATGRTGAEAARLLEGGGGAG